jgi:23S rRNA G2445 N2-methylase RlmL
MKYIGICIKGLEDVAIKEIKEILKVEAKKILNGRLEFEAKDVKKLIEKSQSLVKIYEKWGKLKFKDLDEIKTYVEKKKLKLDSKFKTSCHRDGEHDFNSQTVEREVGMVIDGEHDLKDPEEVVFIDVMDNTFLFGLDLTKKLLNKREYRVKVSNQSINACIAYSMIRLSGYKGGLFLDPFCKDGIIIIEAARYKKGKINGFDDLFHNIRSCEINSKLAQLNKEINLSRIDVEWLDTKFKEGEVEQVVTAIPFPSKHVPEKKIKKIYDQFLYQLKYILSKKAKVVVIGQNLNLFKEMLSDFKVKESRDVKTGGLEQEIVIFTK